MRQQDREKPDPPKADTRRLSVDITPAEDGDYRGAVEQVRRAGVSTTSVSLAWDTIETAPEQFQPETDFLATANAFYPAVGYSVSLAVNPVDMNRTRLPSDLKTRPLDDPEVVRRFCRLLDHVFLRTPKLKLTCLVIGSEIDNYLGADPRRWAQYARFFQATAAHARARRKGLVVGTKITFGELTGDQQKEVAAVVRHADVLMGTYYPLHPDFTVKEAAQVTRDFARMKELSKGAGKPLYLLECGCPSGGACRSSEAHQAEFVRTVFAAWDDAAKEIPLLSFTWLTDLSQRAVQETVEGFSISVPAFRDYLATLGLRTYGGKGTDKAAFAALIEEARRRKLAGA